MTMRGLAFSAFALAAGLAACAGGGSSTSPPNPCPLHVAQPIPAPPQLLYPLPGATSVPDGNFALELSYNNGDLAGEWSAPSLVSGGSTVNAGPYVIVPTPGVYEYTSAVPSLAAAANYAVNVVTPPAGGRCSSTVTLGTFTTK